ncbi:MAG: outer membrane beta-barrel protein [Bacteroidota bacterium]|nr:outer membrane beta-barrel protein [Bacteroidota bacterium]
MKQILLVPVFLFISLSSFAQHSIQAMVFDGKNDLPIEMGAVRILHYPDSTFVQGTQTDLKGNFIIKKVKPGNYILVVSMVGYINYRQNLTMGNNDLILKNIHLKENAHMLSGVEVTGNAAQLVVKGDTTEFNATAFKTTQNAVVEDLLKRLPGVEVGTDGKITVHGQPITKIRVNGKKFFDDDVEMATKNIPAEVIDKVQVFDQKSDMAQLTGFEDNDTEHIINLTFKPNRRKGTFGNIMGGAGLDLNDDVRYDGNMFLNMMDGDNQSAFTAGGNNANTTRSNRGRGAFSNNSGITTMQNIGYNDNAIINPKLKVGGYASFNHTTNETVNSSNKQSYLVDSTYINKSASSSHKENYSANMRAELEWKPDTLNTILFQPNINYNRSFSDNQNSYTNLTDTARTSWGNTSNVGNGTSLSGSLGVMYNHKFNSKRGRTFTANLQTSLSQNNNESFNYSKNIIQTDSTIVDQHTLNNAKGYGASLKMSFVEPLWDLKNFLETSVTFKSSYNTSDKNQYNKDALGTYSKLDSIYSNDFTNNFYSETLELNYRYVDKGFNIMMGVKGNPSQTYSKTEYSNGAVSDVNNEVFNFSPTARLQYNFGKKKFIRIDYRGQTDQPSVSQLQPVKNNSNPMNVSIGNPALNPDFSNSLRLMFTTFNDSTFASLNTFLNAQTTRDALVTNSIYDTTGKQYSQTVNSSRAPYSINGNVMFNIPLIQKRLHFNTNTSFGLNQVYGYSSRGLNAKTFNSDSIPLGNLSSTRRYNAGEMISLTFTNDLFEVGLRGSYKYSNTLNNLNPAIAITRDWSGGGNVLLHLPYNIGIGSDINYTTQQGYLASAQNQLIWNGTIDKTIFNNKGVVALKVVDILHQQKNIIQTIGDNYIQYNTYNTLPTYFLLSFTYKINQFKGTKNPADRRPEFERFGPGPGGDHPRRGGDRTGDDRPSF